MPPKQTLDINEQLIRACKIGSVPGVRAALAAGADVNAVGGRPLGYSAMFGDVDVMRVLLDAPGHTRESLKEFLKWLHDDVSGSPEMRAMVQARIDTIVVHSVTKRVTDSRLTGSVSPDGGLGL